jgi:hypothetical protein
VSASAVAAGRFVVLIAVATALAIAASIASLKRRFVM